MGGGRLLGGSPLSPEQARNTFLLAGVRLQVEAPDESLADEFASVFGGRSLDPPPDPHGAVLATVTYDSAGWVTVRLDGQGGEDVAGELLALSSPTMPLRALPSSEAGCTRLALGGDSEALLEVRGRIIALRAVPRWRRILSHVLYLRMIRLRPDLLFLHAASLCVGGRGVLLTGPKGSGKTTLALALAARGHTLFGDETACVQPSTRELLAFRRPVSIKPGPRAAAVSAAIERLKPRPDEDGVLHVAVESVPGSALAGPAPLACLVFLGGFEGPPRAERVSAGREELSGLQPLSTTLTGEGSPARLFSLLRLVGSLACYRFQAGGDPDAGAAALEEAILPA